MRFSLRARAGISLFEAVAALALVGVTAVSALSAVGAELRTAERARRAMEVEALVTERFSFLSLLVDRELQALPDSVAQGQFDPPLDDYKWAMTSQPNSTVAGLYDVRLTILWNGGSYTASTMQYRRPPIAAR
jgi:type II secretory pathway pseudopilin PulG